ncbi:MAG: hypothetical protein AAGM67_20330, partial [Bacteroidota bacterium]
LLTKGQELMNYMSTAIKISLQQATKRILSGSVEEALKETETILAIKQILPRVEEFEIEATKLEQELADLGIEIVSPKWDHLPDPIEEAAVVERDLKNNPAIVTDEGDVILPPKKKSKKYLRTVVEGHDFKELMPKIEETYLHLLGEEHRKGKEIVLCKVIVKKTYEMMLEEGHFYTPEYGEIDEEILRRAVGLATRNLTNKGKIQKVTRATMKLSEPLNLNEKPLMEEEKAIQVEVLKVDPVGNTIIVDPKDEIPQQRTPKKMVPPEPIWENPPTIFVDKD